mmetsp:Transcript_102414/g.234913  ORF Transcript_102414/g.234913 Transcript_102414/m.234913 type:complete len:307 (-) Transcript_102414:1009-1929(-)
MAQASGHSAGPSTPSAGRSQHHTLSEFQTASKTIVKGYFSNMKSGTSPAAAEAARSLKALDCSGYHDEFVVIVVRSAMDLTEDDLVAGVNLLVLLRKAEILMESQISRGFEKLVLTWQDIQLDVPNAPTYILRCIDAAIRDNCLSRVFLSRLPEQLLQHLSADASLSGEMPVLRENLGCLAQFKTRVSDLLKEYFGEDAGSTADFAARLREANVPHFLHEVVRKAIIMGLDGGNKERERVSRLLCDLSIGETLTSEDILVGCGTFRLAQHKSSKLQCTPVPFSDAESVAILWSFLFASVSPVATRA